MANKMLLLEEKIVARYLKIFYCKKAKKCNSHCAYQL